MNVVSANLLQLLHSLWNVDQDSSNKIQLICAVISTFFLGGLSAYFAWKQIGYSLSFSYSMLFQRTTAPFFGTVTIINWKNRPVSVFKVWAILDNTYALLVHSLDEPHIIQALGTWTFNAEPVSSLHVNRDTFDFGKVRSVKLYVGVAGRLVKCRHLADSPTPIWSRKGFLNVTPSRRKFNGRIYGPDVLYAIIYSIDGSTKTAFIDDAGIISGDWTGAVNGIPREHLSAAENVKVVLDAAGFAKRLGNYSVLKLEQ